MNMKKIVFLSLFALCLPWVLSAQSIDDDLYYVPSKKKEEKTEKKKTPAADAVVVKTNAPTTVYASQNKRLCLSELTECRSFSLYRIIKFISYSPYSQNIDRF